MGVSCSRSIKTLAWAFLFALAALMITTPTAAHAASWPPSQYAGSDSSEGAVVSVTGYGQTRYYTSLADAVSGINAAANSSENPSENQEGPYTLNLLSDIQLTDAQSESISILNALVTIDFQGHTIASENIGIEISIQGMENPVTPTLTLKNGTVTINGEGAEYINPAITESNGCVLSVEDMTIERTDDTGSEVVDIAYRGNMNKPEVLCTITSSRFINGTVSIFGLTGDMTLNASDSSFSIDANCGQGDYGASAIETTLGSANVAVNLTNCQVASASGNAITMSTGSLNVAGGTISGLDFGVYAGYENLGSGNVTINGTAITADAVGVYVDSNRSLTLTDCTITTKTAGIYEQYGTPLFPAAPVVVYDMQMAEDASVKPLAAGAVVTINSGTYTNTAPGGATISVPVGQESLVQVFGGTFIPTPVPEGCLAPGVSQTQTADGTYTVEINAPEGTVGVYRLYNRWAGTHLYTIDQTEVATNVGLGWTNEGILWFAPTHGSGDYAIVRLYNRFNGDHYYVPESDTDQINGLLALGWTKDSEASWFDSASASGTYPIYTLYNPYSKVDTHLYTPSMEEVTANKALGWTQDNTVIWAASLPE